jgi:hypothetical protein
MVSQRRYSSKSEGTLIARNFSPNVLTGDGARASSLRATTYRSIAGGECTLIARLWAIRTRSGSGLRRGPVKGSGKMRAPFVGSWVDPTLDPNQSGLNTTTTGTSRYRARRILRPAGAASRCQTERCRHETLERHVDVTTNVTSTVTFEVPLRFQSRADVFASFSHMPTQCRAQSRRR